MITTNPTPYILSRSREIAARRIDVGSVKDLEEMLSEVISEGLRIVEIPSSKVFDVEYFCACERTNELNAPIGQTISLTKESSKKYPAFRFNLIANSDSAEIVRTYPISHVELTFLRTLCLHEDGEGTVEREESEDGKSFIVEWNLPFFIFQEDYPNLTQSN